MNNRYKYIGQYGELISPATGQYYKNNQIISEIEYYKVPAYHRIKFTSMPEEIFESDRKRYEDNLGSDILDTVIGLSVLDSLFDSDSDSSSSSDSSSDSDFGGFEGGGGDFGGGGGGGDW